ncbi:MAG: acetolactate synthase large subunit [Gammaproteobacteria bacterium]
MNGAESLLRTLVRGGVDVCLTNPGTSEMQFVAAFDRVPEMRCVLGLFEGVVSGAADGYARMTDKPAATLLHLGPGLANGLANFHNAMRARVPVVNIVGDHATYHKQCDAPLTSDIATYARPVSGWIHELSDPKSVPGSTVAAIHAALQPPGRIATLIVPSEVAWSDSVAPVDAEVIPPQRAKVDDMAIQQAATALRSEGPSILLMTGHVLRAQGLELASRIINRTHARVFCDTFNTRLQRGAGRAPIERLPYFPEAVIDTLAGTRHLIIVGSRPPVGFFAYPDIPERLIPPECAVHILAKPEEDGIDALMRLAMELGADKQAPVLQPLHRPGLPEGDLTPETIAIAVASLLPENAIVADESITAGAPLLPHTAGAAPHDWLFITGGAVGQGLPMATGAAIACPDRKVLCLQADGSGMYTLQALWTQAREQLDVTTVIFANRQYRILNIEFERLNAGNPGEKAGNMLAIDRPDIDWVKLAEGMGVPAHQVTTLDEFNRYLGSFLAEQGPNLIEVIL